MNDENVNLLSQEEWRVVHNALSDRQSRYTDQFQRQKLQALMNKIRDNYIMETGTKE
jgi:hypothetical protein